MTATKRVTIYTDGGCAGNPGPGGWGAVLRYEDAEKELYGGAAFTTNNRMELTAAIEALETLKRPCAIELHTDSQYLRNGITTWIEKWKRNGWRTSTGEPVKNADLWRRLDSALERHDVRWHWVRGHSGHRENERADRLARQGMTPFLKQDSARPPTGEVRRVSAGDEPAASRPASGRSRKRENPL